MAITTDSIEDLPTEEGLFPIRTVCALTGIHPVTLRAWERRYGLIRPKRTPKGHRLYSGEDIELINRVLRLLDQGVSIGQVGQLLESTETPPAESTAAPQTPPPGRDRRGWNDYRMRLREAIGSLDVPAMSATWEDALSLFSLDTVIQQLALPLQRMLQERPVTDVVAGAELAFFNRWLRQTLDTRLRQQQCCADAMHVLAVPMHESPGDLGLLLFALAAAQRGIHAHLLTTGAPVAGLETLARRADASAIVLYSDSPLQHSARLAHWPGAEAGGERLPVFAMGPGFEPLPPALELIGAQSLGTDPDKAARRLHGSLLQV